MKESLLKTVRLMHLLRTNFRHYHRNILKSGTVASLLCLLLTQVAVAQQKQSPGSPTCGTTDQVTKYYERNPGAKAEAIAFDKHTKERALSANARQAAVSEYVIPVVFHIFGNEFNGGSTVTDAIVKDALAKTNSDFKGLTANQTDIDPAFSAIKRTLNVTFVLAAKDPNGNATTGINYYPLASGFGNGGGFDTEIQKYAWNNYKYMNVYIMRDLYADETTNNSGVAWYPDTDMSNSNLARVVYNGSYLGTNTDENFRRVLTHEFGHFLNLIHTFDGGCTQPNDQVDDTPPADKSGLGDGCRTGVNCFGNKVNGENFMDYSSCYKMFTNGQVDRMIAALEDHPARNVLWQTTNTNAVLGTTNQAKLLPDSKREFLEVAQNNGTTTSSFNIGVANTTWNTGVSVFVAGTHYTATNVPAGLSVKITPVSSTSVKVELTGTASAHAKANSISNMVITFAGAAFGNGSASGMLSTTVQCKVTFIDSSIVLGTDIQLGEGLSATSSVSTIDVTPESPWRRFFFPTDAPENLTRVGNAVYGAWSLNGYARFEAYQKGIVCDNTDVNEARISLLSYNTVIGPSSNWNTAAAYPNEHYFVSANHTIWKGKTGFVGLKFTAGGLDYYGWLRVGISADGKNISVYDYGYSRLPNTAINAGASPVRAIGKPATELIEDINLNNGAVTSTSNFYLYGDTFVVANGTLTQGTHYTISGVPAGLTPSIQITSSREAVLSFSGTASNHALANKAALTISFQNAAFTAGNAAGVAGNSFGMNINFFDPYEIRYGSNFVAYINNVPGLVNDITVNATDSWKTFNFQANPSSSTDLTTYMAAYYGAWFNAGYPRLEAYENPMLCTDGTVAAANLTALAANTEIGPNSLTWNAGGPYPNEHYFVSSSYTAWKGKTAYFGLTFRDANNYLHYGWVKASVAADGSSLTIIDYAYNTAPNKSILAGSTSGGSDVTAPTAPANLTASNITQTAVTLTWNASTDNVGVTGYDVLRNNVVVTTTTSTSYTNSGLSENTAYSFAVRAKDAAGNISALSNTVNVTTAGSDTQAPTAPANLTASSVTTSGALLNWTASTDNVAVTGYEVRVNNTLTATVTTTNYSLTGLAAATTYAVSVTAKDAAGNASAASSINVTTASTSAYCASKGSSVTDEYMNRVQLGTINNVSGANGGYGDFTAQSTTLSIGSGYTITVTPAWTGTVYSEGYAAWIDYNKDGDFADANEQVWSLAASKVTPVSGTFTIPASALTGATRLRVSMKYNGIPASCETFSYGEVEDYTVTIQAGGADTQAPSAPTALAASNVTQTGVQLNWTASTDNVGVVGYDVFNGTTNIGTSSSTSFAVTGLSPTTTYSFTVKAKDAAGNVSAASNVVTITTSGTSVSYCTVTNGSSGQYITKVTFGSINNSSAFTTGGYADYTAISTAATTNSAINLSVSLQSIWAGSRAGVWIDWNKDGDFIDAGEQVMNASGATASSYTVSVVIPSTARNGNTRMRVRAEYGLASISPCGDGWHSEIEDYTVTISGGAAGPQEMLSIQNGVESVQVYPNPSYGNFTLSLPDNASKSHIQVSNALGAVIKTIESENQSLVDIALDVPPGLYTIRIRTNGKLTAHTLIIK